MSNAIETTYNDLKMLYESNYFDNDEDLSIRENRFKERLVSLCNAIVDEYQSYDDDDSDDNYY